MEAGGSGRLPTWTVSPRLEEGVESGAKIEAANSKGGGWEGVGTQRLTGMIQKTVETVVRG